MKACDAYGQVSPEIPQESIIIYEEGVYENN